MPAFRKMLVRQIYRGNPAGASVANPEVVNVIIIWPDDFNEVPAGPLDLVGNWAVCDFANLHQGGIDLDIMDLPEVDKELGRWQTEIRGALVNAVEGLPKEFQRHIDGGGSDSGDPLDFTLTELNQCLVAMAEARDAGTKLEREVEAVLVAMGDKAVRVREGGGPENLAASLAVSVTKLLAIIPPGWRPA